MTLRTLPSLLSITLATILLFGCASRTTTTTRSIDEQPQPHASQKSEVRPRSTQRFPEDTLFSLMAADLSRARGDYSTAAALLEEQAVRLNDEQLFLEAAWLSLEHRPSDLPALLSKWRDRHANSDVRHAFLAQMALQRNALNEAFESAMSIQDPLIASPFFQEIASRALSWGPAARLNAIRLFETAKAERPGVLGLEIGIALMTSAHDFKSARKQLNQLHQRHPNSSDVTLALTGILANQGALEEASSILKTSLQREFNLDIATQHAKLNYYIDSNEPPTLISLIPLADENPSWYLGNAEWTLERNFLEDAETLNEHLKHYSYFEETSGLIDARIDLARQEFDLAFEHLGTLTRSDIKTRAIEYTVHALINSGAYETYIGAMLQLSGHNQALAQAWLSTLQSTVSPDQLKSYLAQTHSALNTELSLEYYVDYLRENKQDLLADDEMLKFIEQNPNDTWTINNLAYSWINRDINLDEAYALLTHAHRLDPNNASILDSLGWAEYKLGNIDTALNLIKRANELEPHPEILYHLAVIFQAQSNERQFEETMLELKRNYPTYRVPTL